MENADKCPYCGGTLTYIDGGLVCRKCGYAPQTLVFDHRGPRVFKPEDMAKVHFGIPQPDGLPLGSSYIERRDRIGKALNRSQRKVSSRNKSLQKALHEIKGIVSRLHISDNRIIVEAQKIYYQTYERNLVKGSSIKEVAAAAVYVALKRFGRPVQLDDVVEVIGDTEREKRRRGVVNALRRMMKGGIVKSSDLRSDPKTFLFKVGNDLNATMETIRLAALIVEKAKQARLTQSKTIPPIVGAAFQIAGLVHGVKYSNREVAMAVGVTETTVRNRYRELVKNLDILVDL